VQHRAPADGGRELDQGYQGLHRVRRRAGRRFGRAVEGQGHHVGKVGIDLDYLPVNSFRRLSSLLPDLELIDTHPAISAVRAIKSSDEVAYLEKTTKQTHRAVLDAMSASNAWRD
jgi:Xaa-Pro aminopeptidase